MIKSMVLAQCSSLKKKVFLEENFQKSICKGQVPIRGTRMDMYLKVIGLKINSKGMLLFIGLVKIVFILS